MSSHDQSVELAERAERDSALVSGLLHLFAALAIPVLLWDTDVVRRANLWVFASIEVFLGALGIAAFAAAMFARPRLFLQLSLLESIGAALNFAALAWLGADIASASPSKYLLAITFVGLTSIAAANSSMLVHRRPSFLRTLVIVGVSYFVAYALAGEVIFASFTLLWCAALALFSRVGFDAMTELVALRKQSEEIARYDDLTELLNRSAFVEELQDRSNGTTPHTLVLLDLDGFKAINDGFGHAAGDAVLRTVADRLRETFPADTEFGRLGGDEFAALVPIDRIDLRVTLERAVEHVAQAIDVDGRKLYVAGSIGWTHIGPDRAPPELMAEADAAMYASKNSATDSSTGFNPQMRTELDRSLELRQLFRNAIRQESIEFLGQPIVRAGDGFPVAIELLARWPEADDITIGPDEFNRLADETGLAVELDRLALATAANLLKKWRHEPYLESIIVKANVSPVHLQNLVLARSIRNLIPDGDRHRLGLEFVETKLMALNNRHLALLRELGSMGVTISIDDFGTGYSSLAYLRTMPVNEIKIDRTFTAGSDSDPVNRGLVKAIVDLATTLGLDTVAEGVETDAEFEIVTSLGVSSVQGFHVSRPLPLSELGAFLQAGRQTVRDQAAGRASDAG